MKDGDLADRFHYDVLNLQLLDLLTIARSRRHIKSLFQPGGTVLSNDSFRGIDDFEVVAYLIVLPDLQS